MPENPYAAQQNSSGGPDASRGSSRWVYLILGIVFLGAALWLFQAVRAARAEAFRSSCRGCVFKIPLALNAYHEQHGEYPPAYTVDANGKPLHSWRTLILPYLYEDTIYKSIDMTKPWNDPVNARALQSVVGVYHCPCLDIPENMTTYLAVVGPQGVLRPAKSVKRDEITDDPSKTIIVMEASKARAVPWMQPTDVDDRFFVAHTRDPNVSAAWQHENVVLADGSIVEFDESTSPAERRAMVTIAGND